LVPIVEDCEVPPIPDATEIYLTVDVAYGPSNEALVLDVAAPLNATARPLVVMIHGGAWISGDKTDARPTEVILRLAALGYVAASINYRLSVDGNDPFPAAVEDVRCAVRWLRANADSYGIDPSRVGVIGSSAGGHLALMLGTAGDVEGLDGSCPLTGAIDVAGAVSFYGPTDLRPGSPWGVGAGLLSAFLGDDPQNVPELAELASPIAHVDATDHPHLLVHGGGDTLVLPEQSRSMQAAFEAVGVASTYLELASAPHAFDLISDDPALRTSTCTTLAYFAAVLEP
jgi:acetyl esterase/lipase